MAAKTLSKSSKALEALRNPEWESAEGTVRRWTLWGHDKILLVPIDPDGYTYKGVRIGYVELPDYLSDAADTVDVRIPIAHQEYLKYAAAYYLLAMRTDKQFTDMGEYFLAQFYRLIGARNPNQPVGK